MENVRICTVCEDSFIAHKHNHNYKCPKCRTNKEKSSFIASMIASNALIPEDVTTVGNYSNKNKLI